VAFAACEQLLADEGGVPGASVLPSLRVLYAWDAIPMVARHSLSAEQAPLTLSLDPADPEWDVHRKASSPSTSRVLVSLNFFAPQATTRGLTQG
jgi:hypothetical protein